MPQRYSSKAVKKGKGYTPEVRKGKTYKTKAEALAVARNMAHTLRSY